MSNSGKSVEELEELCIQMELKVRMMKDMMKEISKIINKKMREL